MTDTTRAGCMTDAEHEGWVAANGFFTGRHRAKSACLDCPAAFAAEMTREGCCDGTPGRSHRRVTAAPRAWKYATPELRLIARRQQWRESNARRRARLAA